MCIARKIFLIKKIVVSSILAGGLFFSQIWSASLTEVSRNEWAGNASLPSYVKMYIYVPDKLAVNPPIVVSIHACQSSVTGQLDNNKKIKAAADKNGFIMILPDNPGRNCWDVGSNKALTHDGGGDPHAIAQMVRYALKKYKGDSTRVYVLGGSSGAMMTQALLAIYPELFIAGAERAGVPCGCWAESYDESQQWSGPCANGSVSKTAQQWGDLVRKINPNYNGHRPRVQLFHGENDQTINFKNFNESIKQWTNVLGLKTDPDSTAKISPPAAGYTYNQKFWKNKCGYIVLEAWSAPSQPHSMSYEEDAILKFFGLNVVGGKDPELAACDSTMIKGRRGALVMKKLKSNLSNFSVYTLDGRSIYSFSPNIKDKRQIYQKIGGGNVFLLVRKLTNGGTEIVPLINQLEK